MPITFIPRTIDDVENYVDTRRGRVSYPILKAFMGTGYQVAEIDQSGLTQKPQTLIVLLKSYIETHNLPIKVIFRRQRIFLIRLDIDENGNPIPDWQDRLAEEKRQTFGDVEDITSAV